MSFAADSVKSREKKPRCWTRRGGYDLLTRYFSMARSLYVTFHTYSLHILAFDFRGLKELRSPSSMISALIGQQRKLRPSVKQPKPMSRYCIAGSLTTKAQRGQLVQDE